MKIVCLAENSSSRREVGCEHGLSLYIEAGDKRILFDMGQTDLFARNAELLGIDLSLVDIAVISHGHYDHTGGLECFAQLNGKAPIYVSRHAFEQYYNQNGKYIGIDEQYRKIDRLVFTEDEYRIDSGITLYSCNRREKSFELGSFGLSVKRGGELIPDSFLHEQYLEITENRRRVLFSGCSHKGILNVQSWFAPDILVGGFHFSKLPADRTLISYAEYLNGFDTQYYTCHCTGAEQFEFMKKYMSRLHYLSGGQTLDI